MAIPVPVASTQAAAALELTAADRLIVATALAHSLPLATFDSSIRRSQVVPLWPVE